MVCTSGFLYYCKLPFNGFYISTVFKKIISQSKSCWQTCILSFGTLETCSSKLELVCTHISLYVFHSTNHKDPLSGVRQFQTTESPLKMMKNYFCLCLKRKKLRNCLSSTSFLRHSFGITGNSEHKNI